MTGSGHFWKLGGQKWHAAVVQSAFASQNAKNMKFSEIDVEKRRQTEGRQTDRKTDKNRKTDKQREKLIGRSMDGWMDGLMD